MHIDYFGEYSFIMDNILRRTWAEIDLDNVEYNFNLIKSHLNDNVKTMCVIKADAYGHGAVQLAQIYDKLGCDWFAVSNLEEAIQLRKAGFKQDILILGYTNPQCANLLHKYNVTQAVFSYDFADKLSKQAAKHEVTLNVHMKVDTGMTRIGFYAHDEQDINSACDTMEMAAKLSNLNFTGIFTHFAVADESSGKQYTEHQFDAFSAVIDELAKRGITFELRHCCNSAAIMLYPHMHLDMVRPGIILYGLSPSPEMKNYWDFKPVMSLKSTISLVKDVPENVPVSYGGTYITKAVTKIATAAIGYADGYPRVASNKAQMLVNGKRVSLIGRVCMDQLMLDVTGIDGIEEGNSVTIFGNSGEQCISIDELAELAETINYEIACDIGKRVARVYLKNKKEVGYTSLLSSGE